VKQDLIVPEAQDAQAKILERQGSLLIVALLVRLVVAPAVDLDDETRIIAIEIDDVPVDGVLSTERVSSEASRTQVVPEASLGVGLLTSQTTCSTNVFLGYWSVFAACHGSSPLPVPLPAGEGTPVEDVIEVSGKEVSL
jgi:hypothetical protein